MNDFIPLAQLVLAALSLPVFAALGSWVLTRLSAERRLLDRVERLARVYPLVPDGPAKIEYAERVSSTLRALNARLDPLFKVERRRKRAVVVWILVALMIFILVGGIAHTPTEPAASLVGLALGGLAVFAFWLIERDTKRQRAMLGSSQATGGQR